MFVKNSRYIIFKFYMLFFLITLYPSYCFTQNYRPLNQYTSQTWTPNEGLPNIGALDIVQADDGFIWVGTFGGIARFDGVFFETFDDIFEENELIYSVIELGENNSLWLGSSNGLFHYKNGNFERVGGKSEFSPYVESILVEDNHIWVGTRNDGIHQYKDGSIKKYNLSEELGKAFISDIIVDEKEGGIWFTAPQQGVYHFKNDKLQKSFPKERFASNILNSLYQDNKKDRLWVCTNGGLNYIENDEVYTVADLKGIDCIHINYHKGYYYISTSLGLYVMNQDIKVVDTYASKKSPQLVATYFDHEGNLWLAGYRNGLNKLSPKKFLEYSQENGLDGNGVNTIVEIAKDSILIGNDVGNVFSISKSGINLHPITSVTQDKRIRHIYQDRFSNLWFSTYDGIYKFFAGSIANYQWINDKGKLSSNSTRFTAEDSEGNYWVGTRNALLKLDSAYQVTTYTKNEGLTSDFILGFFENKINGDLWIGTAGGGANLIKKNGEIQTLLEEHGEDYNVVFSFHQAKDSSIWITHNGGISRYTKGKFQTVENIFGIDKTNIFEIESDNLGYLWLSSTEGIFRVQEDSLIAYLEQGKSNVPHFLFNKSDGIKVSSATPNANILKDQEGNLWFPMVFGILKIDPHNIPRNTLIPPVYVTNIKVDGQNFYAPFQDFEIPRETKRIQIDYSGLSFQAIEKVKFKCKLEGYDEEWVEMGNKRFIEYTNLSPGTYTFRVIASNNDGVWNEEGDNVVFVIKPAFYETNLFYILVSILFLGAVFSVFRFRTYQIRKRNRELTKQVELRTIEIQQKVEQLEQQNEEVRIANEKVNQANNSLEETLGIVKDHQNAITASINYAQRIQQAMLPTKAELEQSLPEHFILFRPRDVVSGDFYWMSDLRKMNGRIILAAIDCTGHGVPGAFMSMVANDMLNYIVNEKQITRAELILTMLHREIRRVLKQNETNNQDGMDMSLVVIDYNKNALYFSGAKNPLVYVQNDELKFIKGDRMPIGGEQRETERNFTQHEIDLSSDLTFYIFSDGLQDQFGGPKGRKFSPKRMRQLFFDIHKLPAQEQKLKIAEVFDDWKGDERQIDDVLMIGVKI